MSARPKTLDETIELANDLMDQKLRTYIERQNENKRKTDDSSRNNQQQPHKKQNVARAYTVGPGKKKVYTGDLPVCTKCNYLHIGQCAPKCGKCKRNGVAQGRAYALGERDASWDSNVITVQAVDTTDDSPSIPEHTTVETPMNMSPANKAHFELEKEAIYLILTGIGDEIYSTVDACQTA
nr:reverse transcriptase domain-containing protein [Tanacetum cinerariifolium]